MKNHKDTNLFFEDKTDEILSKLDSIEKKVDQSKYWFWEYLVVWLVVRIILKFF